MRPVSPGGRLGLAMGGNSDSMDLTPMCFPGQGFGARPFRMISGRCKPPHSFIDWEAGDHEKHSTIRKSKARGRAVLIARSVNGSAQRESCESPYCGIPSRGRGRAKAMGQDGKAVGRLKEHAICGAGIDAEPNKEPYREPQRFGLAWLKDKPGSASLPPVS